MEQMLKLEKTLEDIHVDRYGYLRPSALLYMAQEAAGQHSALLGTDFDTLQKKGLFWAVTRHGVTVRRLPRSGERIFLETWPMPATRVAYPRMVEARDEQGDLLFQVLSLWVLMDVASRGMVLPGKSGVDVPGTVRGTEPDTPKSLPQVQSDRSVCRTVTYSCLDRNGHMNNTRYLDWVDDLPGSDFHSRNRLTGFTVCYLNEAREGDRLEVSWTLSDGVLEADVHRENTDEHSGKHRVFGARMTYCENIM